MRLKEAVPDAGKDEMNLVEYPITLLSKRHESETKTIEFSDVIKGDGGKLVKREWIVTGSDKYGLPLAQDNDVLLALLTIGKEQNFQSRKIFFSRYRLCQIMGWKLGGANYNRVEETLKRFKGVSIYAKNALWDNKKKSYITMGFGIIDEFYLFDSPRSVKHETLPLSYVNLGEVLYESIKAGYIKSIDIKTYYELESFITKRLYRYLDKKRYDGKRKFEIDLFTLAYTHIGFDEKAYRYASLIKNKLNHAHEELVKAGFLKGAEYRKTNDGDSDKVIYTFVKNAGQDEPRNVSSAGEKNSAEPSFRESDPLVARLLEIGVTRAMAEQIVREYSAENIETQMDILPHRNAKDPAAVLVAAIKESWEPPASFKRKSGRNKYKEAEKLEHEMEEQQKAEQKKRVEDYIAKLSPAEQEALRAEAGNIARKECAKIFINKDVPRHVINGYVHIMVERRLNHQG
jgi:hypothetical protein